MATFTDNFALVKPTYGELADVAVINGNMDTVDGIMHSNRTMLAPAFSQTEDYAEDDVVVYEGNLYRFIVPHTAGNWDGSEVEQTTLGEEVATKGGADVTKTASGNPIEISDGASAPLVNCVTEIQGSQDLHGYTKPWVGGAGKNKLEVTGSSTTVSGVTFTVNSDGTILVNGTATADIQYNVISNWSAFPAGNYILNGCPSGLSNMNLYVNPDRTQAYYDNGSGVSFSVTSEIIVRIYMASGVTANNILFKPMIRIASETDPTFAPYSNICPITAYTEGEIEVRGKNLLDNTATTTTINGVTFTVNADGTVVASGTATANTSFNVGGFTGRGNYKINGISNGSVSSYYFQITNSEGTTQLGYFTDGDYDFEVTQDILIRIRAISGAVLNNVKFYPMIRLASETDPTYEPYTSTTHTTTYPSAIYRGSEDVVNGEVTSEWVKVIVNGTNVQGISTGSTIDSEGGKRININIVNAPPYSDQTIIPNIISDSLNAVSSYDMYIGTSPNTISINDIGQITIRYKGCATVEDAVNALNAEPIEIAYPLATPTTSSVTPTNLPIKSLSGYNHIESSTGDMEVEYITQDYQPLVDLIQSGNGHTYSTSEQIVGKWTDGKDVYEKTIYYATLSCDRNDWAQLEALDAETFISYSATAYMETASGRQIDNNYIRISYYNGYLYHHEPEFGTGMVDLYVTVRYTKPSSNTRSLNLTKSAVSDSKEELPDEIKNAPFEEKPETNEADDDAPTEVER